MSPILFHIGDQPIYAFGVLLGLALALGWYLTLFAAGREGLDKVRVALVLAVVITTSLLGARALYFVTNPDRWQGLGSFLTAESGGLVIYGGFLGGILSGALATRAAGLGFWRFADLAAPQMALGLAVGRLGCFFYGCDFGRRTTGGFAVQFPQWGADHLPWIGRACGPSLPACGGLTRCDPQVLACVAKGSPAWSMHSRLGYIEHGDLLSAPVHPVQIYAAVFGFALFVGLVLFRRRKAFQGQVLLLFVGVYAVWRAVVETFREDPQRGAVWTTGEDSVLSAVLVELPRLGADGRIESVYALTTSQLISGILLMAALGGWWMARRRQQGRGTPLLGDLGEPPTAKEKGT